MTVQQDMLAEAKKLIGTPYKDKGRDEGGIDCAGLLVLVARRLELPHYDSLDYARRPSPIELKRVLDNMPQLERLADKWAWETGDIGNFSTDSHPVHLGILERDEADRWFIIHSWAPARKVVRSETSKEDLVNYTKLKLRRVYRYKG